MSQALKQHSPKKMEIDLSGLSDELEIDNLENLDADIILFRALQALELGDFQQRWDVAKIIPRLGSIAIKPLLDILQDDNADLDFRWFAGRILGEFQDAEVIDGLIQVLQTSDNEELMAMAATTLANFGNSAIAALSDLLQQEETRFLATRSLAHIRTPETIDPLLSVVNDRLPNVRSTAIEALASFHDSRIIPVLITALKDTSALVRKESAIALGFRAYLAVELDLVNHLQPLLYDINIQVCQQAAIAIGRLKTDSAATTLFQVLASPYTPASLQIDIIRALAWMETPQALEYLQQALTLDFAFDSVSIYQEIIAVLSRVKSPDLMIKSTDILINFLPNTNDSAIKQAIAMGLRELGDIRSINPLIQLLTDSDIGVRLYAISALKYIAPEDLYQKLEGIIADEKDSMKFASSLIGN